MIHQTPTEGYSVLDESTSTKTRIRGSAKHVDFPMSMFHLYHRQCSSHTCLNPITRWSLRPCTKTITNKSSGSTLPRTLYNVHRPLISLAPPAIVESFLYKQFPVRLGRLSVKSSSISSRICPGQRRVEDKNAASILKFN